MSRPSNQTVERYYFDLFQSHYKVPDGARVFTDKPDVIVRGAQTIGIEIANLYISSGADPASEQVQRLRRLQILERAQSLHLASGGRSIELSVDFNTEHPIHEIETVAQALATIAKQFENLPSGLVRPSLLGHVHQLRALYHNAEEYVDAKWRPVQRYGLPSLSLERLRDLVHNKNKKLQAYQPCDFYWLLLVVDFMDPAQDQDLHWPAGVVLEKSPFERILLYKPQFAQVVRVPQ